MKRFLSCLTVLFLASCAAPPKKVLIIHEIVKPAGYYNQNPWVMAGSVPPSVKDVPSSRPDVKDGQGFGFSPSERATTND